MATFGECLRQRRRGRKEEWTKAGVAVVDFVVASSS